MSKQRKASGKERCVGESASTSKILPLWQNVVLQNTTTSVLAKKSSKNHPFSSHLKAQIHTFMCIFEFETNSEYIHSAYTQKKQYNLSEFFFFRLVSTMPIQCRLLQRHQV